MPRATAAALLVALSILTLAGCSQDQGQGAGDAAPERTATSAPQPTEPSGAVTPPLVNEPKASTDVATLREQVLDANTGSFTSDVLIADTRFRRTGIYSLRQASSDTTTTIIFSGDEQPLSIHTIAIDQTGYAQIYNGSGYGKCWFRYPPEFLGELNNTAPVGYTAGIPAEVGVVASSQAGRNGERPTSDLATVVSLVGGKLASALGVSPDDTTRTPVTLLADDQGITGWETDLEAVVTSATQAGNTIAPQIDQLLALSGPDGATLSGSLDSLGAPVDIQAPPRNLQVEVTRDEAAFQAAIDACEQR